METDADRLNGIEWHGRAYLNAPYRFYNPPKNQCSEWSDPISPSGLSLQGPVAALVIHGTKKQGKWEFKTRHEVEILACIPAVQGLFWREAKATLERYGLHVGELSREHSESVARDTVIAQSPPADSILMKGSAVSLVVSDGLTPVSYTMPDLRGRPQDVANEMVTSIGPRVEKVSYTDRPDAPAGSVIGQQPLPGHKLAAGEGVALVLAKDEPPPGAPARSPCFSTAFRLVPGNGACKS